MKTILAAGAAVAILATAASGAAVAQGPRQGQFQGQGQGQIQAGRPQITLYQLPNYQGAARTFTAGVDNLADQGFNDLAQSVRVQGRWRVCEDARLRGRCVELSGDVPDLGPMRMTVAISSFDDLNGAGPGGGFQGGGQGGGFGQGGGQFDRNPPGGGFGGGNFGGVRTDGRTASFFPQPQPGPYRNADEFCRRMGFTGVIYADDRGQGLRDVVCRR
jgi:hypothetical protein